MVWYLCSCHISQFIIPYLCCFLCSWGLTAEIEQGDSPENSEKEQQHAGDEAVAHFLLSTNTRGTTLRRTLSPSFLSHLSTWNIDAPAAIRNHMHSRCSHTHIHVTSLWNAQHERTPPSFLSWGEEDAIREERCGGGKTNASLSKVRSNGRWSVFVAGLKDQEESPLVWQAAC